MKQQEIRRNKGKKTKTLRNEETENTRKTATILWLSLGAIFNYKTGHVLRFLPFLGPPSEVTAINIYQRIYDFAASLHSQLHEFLPMQIIT